MGVNMTLEELKAEAKKQGYVLLKSQAGYCTCWVYREEQLTHRRKCKEYEFCGITTRGKTICKRCEHETNDI